MRSLATEVSPDTSFSTLLINGGGRLCGLVSLCPSHPARQHDNQNCLLSCAVWLACTLSFLLGLPSLGSSVAFSAATSIATIGLYISYGNPLSSTDSPTTCT